MAKRIAGSKAEALQQQVEGTRKGLDLDQCDWLDSTLVTELRNAMRERAKIKREEEALAKRKDDATTVISSMLEALGIDTAYIRSVGSVVKYEQTRRLLDQDKLKQELLNAGMPAEILVKCFANATKQSTSAGVRFTLS